MAALADKFGRYVRSTSTRTAAFVGLLTYLSYAYAHGSWANPALIGVSLFVGLFLPTYAKLSNKAELWAQQPVRLRDRRQARAVRRRSTRSIWRFSR